MDAPRAPEIKSNTWRLRVTERERALVAKRAKRDGWEGYSAWFRERLLWAATTGKTAPNPEGKAHEGPRSGHLTARFGPRDLKFIRAFCKRNRLGMSAWARAIAMTPNKDLQTIA